MKIIKLELQLLIFKKIYKFIILTKKFIILTKKYISKIKEIKNLLKI